MSKLINFLKKHIKLIIALVIIVIVAIVVKIKVFDAKNQVDSLNETTMTTAVEKMDLQSTVSVTGTLTAQSSASVTSTASGKQVDDILYEVGDYVEAGETVVTFISSDADYEQKVAELDAKYDLDEVEYENSLVKYQHEIDDYTTQITELQEDIDENQEYLDDNKNIYENLCDARDEWVNAQKNYSSDSNEYKKCQTRYNTETAAASVLADPVSISLYEAAEDLVEEYADKMNDLQYNLLQAQYNLEKAQLDQDYKNEYTKADEYEQYDSTKVVAPISGYITNINVEEGNNYTQGSTVFTISDTDGFIVEGTVDEYDIASLAEGQSAVVKFDATDDDEFTGTLTYVAISPASSTTTSSTGVSTTTTSTSSSSGYTVKITLDSTDERLRVGMTAKASVILDSVTDVLAVPYDCVETASDGTYYVTTVDDEGNESKVTVEKGMESDYYVAITGDGISEGTKVKATASSGTSSDTDDMMNMGGDMGGGPGGDMGGGGAPSGGGPGGGF